MNQQETTKTQLQINLANSPGYKVFAGVPVPINGNGKSLYAKSKALKDKAIDSSIAFIDPNKKHLL